MTRRCIGLKGKKCGSFLSNEDVDPHRLCHNCVGHKCTREETCPLCDDWSEGQWKKFEGRRSYQVQQGNRTPTTPITPGPKSVSPMPVLTKESPLGNFETPKGRPLPMLPPVTPTPVKKLQRETQERFVALEQSLTQNFGTKIDTVQEMIRVLTERMTPMRPPPGYALIGPHTPTQKTVEEVEVIVVEKIEETPPSSIKPPPEQIVDYLEDTWPSVPPSKTSRSISEMRRATSSSRILQGEPAPSDPPSVRRVRPKHRSVHSDTETRRDLEIPRRDLEIPRRDLEIPRRDLEIPR